MDKITEMLQMKEMIDVATLKYDTLRKQVEAEMWDENIQAEYNWTRFNIIKIRRLSFNLKAGLNQLEIMDKYPLAVKTSLDLDVLKATPEAHDLFEPKESVYIAIKTLAKTNTTNDRIY